MLLEEKTKASSQPRQAKCSRPAVCFPLTGRLQAHPCSVELATQCLGRSDTLLRDPTTAGDAVPWHQDRRALP